MMKKSKLLLILFGFIVTIISIVSMLVIKQETINTKFIVQKGTYAYQYAKNNNIEVLYDSNKNNYVRNIEQFIYNEINGGLEIIGYNGISKELIIPRTIEGKKVVSINTNFEKLKKLIISENIKTLNVDLDDITLVCYKNELCNNTAIKTELIPDSEINQYYFGEFNIDFVYEIDNQEIEIENYIGNSKSIVIPETINGYKVTKVDFELKNNIEEIYIPKTVVEIDLESAPTELIKYSILSILSFVIYCGFVIFTSDKKDSINNFPSYIISLVYLIGILTYLYININNSSLFVIYIALTLIYIFINLALILASKKIIKYDEEVKTTGGFIKEALSIIEELKDNTNLTDLEKLEENIKYSDPVSSNQTLEIEKEIINDIKNIKTNDSILLINKKVEKRNKICKENK